MTRAMRVRIPRGLALPFCKWLGSLKSWAETALREQADTTMVIYPNQVAKVDDWGNLILRTA